MLLHLVVLLALNSESIFAAVHRNRVPRQTNDCEIQQECKQIQNCPSIYNLLSNNANLDSRVTDIIRRSKCEEDDSDVVKVCCPVESTTNAVQTSFTTPSENSLAEVQTTIPPQSSTTKKATTRVVSTTTTTTTIPKPKSSTTTTSKPKATANDATTKPKPKSTTTTIPTTEFATPVSKVPLTTTEMAKPISNYSVCGHTTYIASKVIGGGNAGAEDWPWIAALGYWYPEVQMIKFACGGTLISEKWVLTAAHCIRNQLSVVRFGDLDLYSDNDGVSPININVSEKIPHPQYTSSPVTNDIGLIRLETAVTFTTAVHPICIMNTTASMTNAHFYEKYRPFIIGYGYLKEIGFEGRVPAPQLQIAQIGVTSNENCKKRYSTLNVTLINEFVICAGNRSKDACGGDSGGPLMVPLKGTYYVAGIVSVGAACGQMHGLPGVYTKVSRFLTWISDNTGIQFPAARK